MGIAGAVDLEEDSVVEVVSEEDSVVVEAAAVEHHAVFKKLDKCYIRSDYEK